MIRAHRVRALLPSRAAVPRGPLRQPELVIKAGREERQAVEMPNMAAEAEAEAGPATERLAD